MRQGLKKIEKSLDDILAHQDHERDKEFNYLNMQVKFSAYFFYLTLGQLAVVLISVVFTVVNLRKFFVKKAIF